MFERCGAGHGDVVPPAQLRSGVLGRPHGLWSAEHIEFGHPAHPAVPACPDHSQPAAVTQHPGDLRDGLARIQPVPRRGDEHSVRARVRNRKRLAPARDSVDPGGAGGQYRAHPLVRLDRDDVCDPVPQRPGEKARASGDIDRDLTVLGDQPVQCLVRRTGPHPVIIVGYLAEGGRPSFTSSHVRTLTRVPSPIPGHHWPRTVICGGQHAQLGPFGTVCLANLAVRLLPYGSRVRRAATARSGCPQDR